MATTPTSINQPAAELHIVLNICRCMDIHLVDLPTKYREDVDMRLIYQCVKRRIGIKLSRSAFRVKETLDARISLLNVMFIPVASKWYGTPQRFRAESLLKGNDVYMEYKCH